MANFKTAYEISCKNEGKGIITNISNDKGGQTYSGISRKFHPNWEGWVYIDSKNLNDPKLETLVEEFYKKTFWDAVMGDSISDQSVANSIYDFSINVGTKTASKIVQKILGVTIDGIIGNKTISSLNAFDSKLFNSLFTNKKIEHYKTIVEKDSTQLKFLVGWINRSLKMLDNEI